MKKIFAVIVFTFATVTVCNAQFFIGGEFGIGASSSKDKATVGGISVEEKNPSSFGLEIGPKFGYFFNDKWSIGLMLVYNYNQQTTHVPSKVKTMNHLWGGSPYVRWAFARVKNFSFVAEGMVNFRGGFTKTDPSANDTKTYSFLTGFNIAPVITYNLGEHFVFETRLNFLSLGYTFRAANTIRTVGNIETSNLNLRHDFNFSVDSDNILNVGAITIGAIYKF